MASLEARRNKDGTITWRVIWRQNGERQTEIFRDYEHSAVAENDARHFKVDVEAAGNRWPAGWLRGDGYEGTTVRIPEAEMIDGIDAALMPTVLEHALAYTESKHTKAAPEHRLKMRRTFEQNLGVLASMRLDLVTREDVQQWVDKLAARYKYKTVKERRGMLSSAYEAAVADGLVSRNPVKHTSFEASEDACEFEPVFLQRWEVDAIIARITESHRAYVETLVRTGMRPGEAFALRVGQVDLNSDYPAITIVRARKHSSDGNHRTGTTKTRAGRRTVLIDHELVKILRAHIGHRSPTALLFAEHGNDGSWQRNHWVPAVKAATLPRQPRVYDLRHTHASMLLAAGMPLFAVSKRLGHKDIQTTANIYGHLDRSTDAASAAAIGVAMRRVRPVLHVVQ